MRIKLRILFIAFTVGNLLLAVTPAFAQMRDFIPKDSVINQLDHNGLKNGLWQDNFFPYGEEGGKREVYYRNGIKRNFIERGYNSLSYLTRLIAQDEVYYFDYDGFIYIIETNIHINTQWFRKIEDNSLIFKPKYRGYMTKYHLNGEKKMEGQILHYPKEIMYDYYFYSDNVFKIGEWRYYNEEGVLTNIEDYESPVDLKRAYGEDD